MAKRQNYDISMDSIHLEGSLFVPDMLEKVAKGNALFQSAAEYHIPKGIKLTDEFGRAFQIALAQWKDFKASWEREDVDHLQATQNFIVELFNDALGWGVLKKMKFVRIEEFGYPVQFLGPSEVPMTVTEFNKGIDDSDERFAVTNSGYRKRTPFQMIQEFLNSRESQGWGVVTNGRQVRLLRSSATLARPQYLEFDIESILDEQRYADFTAFWRIMHGSRIVQGSGVESFSIWEQWRINGIDEGLRVRDGLREGVTRALLILGTGFIAHPNNRQLRDDLNSGKLSKDGYFQQLLRLIYRFLFLFAMEERKSERNYRLLHIQDDSQEMDAARDLYDEGYSLLRLREKTLRWMSYDSHDDLWQAILVVFSGLATGEPLLALPALGGLFDQGQCEDLDRCMLGNKELLHAMYYLRWTSQGSTISAVDYKNMGSEELGSVYESLLELVPMVDIPAKKFSFIGIEDEHGSTAGNARKTTGSYYTPDSLVQELIKSALIPVIEQKLKDNPKNPVESLLSLSVIDPACGSGHFLLAAARKLAEYLASKRSTDGVVLPSQYRHALRDVISHCLYGVDLNPMAVELARMALWLEGFEPGKPLSFLNHHILCGNSLLGMMDMDEVYKGIPNEAFKALTGDDPVICSELRKENAKVLKQLQGLVLHQKQPGLFGGEDVFVDQVRNVEALGEDDLDDIAAKEQAWKELLEAVDSDPKTIAADLIIAAFLQTKTSNTSSSVATNHTVLRVLTGYPLSSADTTTIAEAKQLCEENHVFHWPTFFPKVFEEGGFDVVLGNPPWDVSQFSETEFFSQCDPKIASLKGNTRKKAILALEIENNRLFSTFTSEKHRYEVENIYYRYIGRFDLSAIGKLNLYPLFTNLVFQIKKQKGRVGFIVPSGIATDDSTKVMFSTLVSKQQLVSLYDFENKRKLFPAVDSRIKFCLLTLGETPRADFAFFLTNIAQLPDQRRHFQLTAEEFALINPNTMTCPIFRSKMDAELTMKVYRRIPILINDTTDDNERGNPWGVSFKQGLFNMTAASHLFSNIPEKNLYSVYEGKMIHQFDHRWGTWIDENQIRHAFLEEKKDLEYEVSPRYWVDKKQVLAKLADVPSNVMKAWLSEDEGQLRKELAACREDQELQGLASSDRVLSKMSQVMEKRSPKWLMGWRDICRSTDERTVIASVLARVGVGHKLPLFSIQKPSLKAYQLFLFTNFNALVLDYIARQKMGGTDLTYFYLKQFPFLQQSQYSIEDHKFITPRVIELVYTSEALRPWAEDMGYHGDPFPFDPERRAILRAELDARYARLYGLNREELMYVLDPSSVKGEDYPSETFRVLKNNEIRDFGEYRTMRLVLEAWDRDNP